MNKAIKVGMDDNKEFSIGFNERIGKAYMQIDSEFVKQVFDKGDQVSQRDLENSLWAFKNVIDDMLQQLK